MSDTEYKPKSAVRYGGQFGPNAARPPAAVTRSPLPTPKSTKIFGREARQNAAGRKRTWLLMALAFPLVFAGIIEILDGNAFGAIRDFGLFALVVASIQVIRAGLAAEAEFDAREFAAAPKLPRKIIGSLMLGGTLGLTALLGWDVGLFQSIGFGILGAAASLFSFGADPMKGKGYTTVSGITPDMVIEALDEARGKIEGIENAAQEIKDRPLHDRLARVTRRARDILGRIEQDPSDLRRARKFLKVYLDGAHDATVKYAQRQDDLAGDSTMYVKFRSLLDDMERQFDRQYDKLLTNDRIDLDVEIDVLAERLKRESAL